MDEMAFFGCFRGSAGGGGCSKINSIDDGEDRKSMLVDDAEEESNPLSD